MPEDKILQKLDQQDKKFEVIIGKLVEHDMKFEQQSQKLAQHDQKFEAIIGKLVEHDEKLDNMVPRDEFHEFKAETTRRLEEIITIIKRLDQERVFLAEWIKRIEDRVARAEKQVEDQKEEILKMKLLLKLT